MAARFRAAVDGGARGNPGPGAWGVVVLDGDDGGCEAHAGFIEYRAPLEALRPARAAAAEIGPR